MELIYLWIDGYKNLKNFEINLNSAYKGNINENCKIIIEENKDDLNFFGENLNIMTIIGQNGCGKSNIVNALSSIFRNISLCHNTNFYDENKYDDNDIPENCKFCIVIKSNGKFSAYCSNNCINDIEIKLTTKESEFLIAKYNDIANSQCVFRKRKLDQSEIKINVAKFQPFYRKDDSTPVDFTRWNGIDNISKIKLNNYFYYDRFRLYDTVRSLIELYEFNKGNKLKIFEEEERLLFNRYSPYLDIYEALGWAYDRIKNKDSIDTTYPIISLLGEYIKNIRTKIRNNSYSEKTIDSLFEDVLPILFFTYALGEIYNLIENYELEENLEYIIKSTIGIKPKDESTVGIKEKLIKDNRLKIYKKLNKILFGPRPVKCGLLGKGLAVLPNNYDSERLKNMLAEYINYEEKQIKKKILQDKYCLLKGRFIQLKEPVNFEDINKQHITEIESLKGISKNLYMNNGKNYYDFMSLSTGEQRFLRFFADIYYCADKLKDKFKTDVFLFDEMDLSWHPEWQRKMVFYVFDLFNNILKKNNKNRKINIIFTTHSPFILSDMPQNNVVRIEKDKNSNIHTCRAITNTFASNIHELFKNIFFMSSTMGEFAKETIQNIILDINNVCDKTSFEELEQKICIIGEPIIQTQLLKKLYDEKYLEKIKDEKELCKQLKLENQQLKREILKLKEKTNEEN